MSKFYFSIIMLILLSGCSTASTIQRADISKSEFDNAVYSGKVTVINDELSDKDAYRVFHQAATGFVSIQSIRASSEKRANEFCERKGKSMQALRERTSVPPHILGNFPRIEIIFACVDIAESTVTYKDIDKYEQLKKLKALLDDDAIKNEEFTQEKLKLLSK
jgi:hypothetical protein